MKRILIGLLIIFLISGCAQKQETTEPILEKPFKESETREENRRFTMQEISKHITEQDCWLLIEGKVYDVTDFIAGHPGGKAILQGCGTNATELFNTRPMGSKTPHTEKARNWLKEYNIGEFTE